MGLTMKGIQLSPIAVVVHLLTGRLKVLFFERRNIDKAHTRFIVNPGIAMDASVCQINVSAAARILRSVPCNAFI
jgi:hypothetical protein